MGTQVHNIKQHRTNASPEDIGFAPAGKWFTGLLELGDGSQAFLATNPENVESDHAQQHDQGIGGELAAGQSFHIQVGFVFRMELLAFSVLVIRVDDQSGLLAVDFSQALICGEHLMFGSDIG